MGNGPFGLTVGVYVAQQERALLAGIVLVDSCLCETEKVRHIDGEERNPFAVS